MSVCNTGPVQAENDELWGFTRPDSSASGMFFFQNCGGGARILSGNIPYLESSRVPRLHPSRRARGPGQRSEVEGSAWQASMTARPRHLQHRQLASPRGGFPMRTLPVQYFKIRWWSEKPRSMTEPSRMASVGAMFPKPFMAAPNRVSRSRLSGLSSQIQKSSLTLSALLKAVLFTSLAWPISGSRRVSVR